MATTSAAGTLGMRRKSLSITETRIAGLYDLDRTIGKGHFAVVKLARHAFTGEKVAVKVIDKTKLDAVSKEHIMQEVRCMKLVQHPCVVRLYEVIDTQTKLFLILELGDYDMHEFMQRHVRGVAEPEAQRLFAQIINAIDYCHQLHVVHRDLKPENVVFFDKINMVKVTDFGFSNVYAPGTTLDTSCGSLAYSAPEILLGDSYDAPAVDIWSLGVILFMLVAGRLPFEGPNDSETLTKILDCRYHMPEHVSQTCRKLVGRMLIRDPRKRASLKEIRENAWVKGGDFGQVQMLPLVGREQLCDDDHDTIVEQMVMGGVGTAVQINHALEHEQYSHLTATYYLLAESVLRVERQKKAQALMEAQARSNPELGAADAENVPPGDPSPPETYANSEVTSNATTNRQRSCSMVKEESEEELSVLGTSRRSSRATSPSTSTFGLARYVQDRVSPAAIQEMLDVTGRLSSGRRSPDSLSVTSRSPSPPFERTPGQPVTISAIASRLKSGPAGPPGGGGIRKLSSSPHLFGICEELEEGEQAANEGSESPKADRSSSKTTTGGDDGNDTSGSSDITQRESAFRQPVSTARQLRRPFSSSATGILAAASGGHPAQSLQLQPGDADTSNRTAVSYSSVRMIRPRQAIVSPDMLRRYDRPSSCNPSITTAGAPKGTSVVPKTGSGAKSGTSRSRRSTSCSSSEASDDESRKYKKHLKIVIIMMAYVTLVLIALLCGSCLAPNPIDLYQFDTDDETGPPLVSSNNDNGTFVDNSLNVQQEQNQGQNENENLRQNLNFQDQEELPVELLVNDFLFGKIKLYLGTLCRDSNTENFILSHSSMDVTANGFLTPNTMNFLENENTGIDFFKEYLKSAHPSTSSNDEPCCSSSTNEQQFIQNVPETSTQPPIKTKRAQKRKNENAEKNPESKKKKTHWEPNPIKGAGVQADEIVNFYNTVQGDYIPDCTGQNLIPRFLYLNGQLDREISGFDAMRLALSRHCAKHATGRHRRRSGDDKDEGGDGAHAAAGRQAAPTAALSHAKGGQAQQSSGDSNADPGSSSGTKKGRAASAGDVEGPDELQCSCNGKQPSSGLDTSRLIGKLQNLALAPIHEIPQCLPRFMRTASYEVRRASRLSLRNGDTEHSAQQATGDCDMALNQRAGSSAGGDLVRMDLYVRKLRRSRSAERLCHISQPIPEEDEATSRPPIDGMRGDTERVARWLRFSVPENDVIDCEPDAAINSPDYGSILPAGPAAGAQANMAAMYSDSSDEGFHGSHHSSPCEEHLSPLGKQCEVDSAKIDHSIPSTVQVGVQ